MIPSRKKIFLLPFVLLSWLVVNAQPHPILDDFFAFHDNDKIVLKWTISSGSTCDGIRIYRSSDSAFFTQIGYIDGICGNSSSAISYEYSDEVPVPNQVNYYRLELGIQGFSDFVSIEYIKLLSGNYLIRPNPVVDVAQLFFRNESHLPMKFTLLDLAGNMIMTKENITDDFLIFDRGALNNGFYLFTIENRGNIKVKGKIILSSR